MWGGVVTEWYKSQVATMDLEVKENIHTCLYVGHVGKMINGFYMHCGYRHACHSISIVITCMIDAN